MKIDFNLALGIIGVILAILGLVASYYFYKRSLRDKEPVYAIKNTQIISGYNSVFPNLKVSYKTKKIEDFSASKVLFYNRGTDTITQFDIDTINHLKITAKEGVKILDASILQVNNPSSQFTLDVTGHQVLINFDYINKGDGAVFQVLHTGSSKEDMNIVGDIKGVNKIVKLRPETYKSTIVDFLVRMNTSKEEVISSLRITQTFQAILTALIILVVVYRIFFHDYSFLMVSQDFIITFLMVITFLTSVSGLIETRDDIKHIQENRVAPRGLELFYD